VGVKCTDLDGNISVVDTRLPTYSYEDTTSILKEFVIIIIIIISSGAAGGVR